jgi:hypothetical protein
MKEAREAKKKWFKDIFSIYINAWLFKIKNI